MVLRGLSGLLGRLPPGFGQAAAARFLYRNALAGRTEGCVTRQTMAEGALLELALSERTEAEAFVTRRHEPAAVRMIVERLPARGGVFVDVGAHVGLVTFAVAAARGACGVEVHAFEPNIRNAGAFRRNQALNPHAHVTLHDCAVGGQTGVAKLLTPADGSDAAASRISTGGALAGLGEHVAITTLDDFAERSGLTFIDVLKLDVEGHEPEALLGGRGLLEAGQVGFIVCEANDSYLAERDLSRAALAGQLADWGYQPAIVPRVGGQRLRPRRDRRGVAELAFERGARVRPAPTQVNG
jgi:FkbM family methyltransferase